MITALTIAGATLVLLLIATAAYHRGRREGRVTLPSSLVTELRGHKLRCLGEPAQRVALEIGLLCDTANAVEPAQERPHDRAAHTSRR